MNRANVLIINENHGSYIPLFLLGLHTLSFENHPENHSNDNQKGKITLKVNVGYYNSSAGFFEPAVDMFGIDVELD